MGLEVGKTYRTRDGEEVIVTSYRPDLPFPYLATGSRRYTELGHVYGPGCPDDDDLVEEVKKKVKKEPKLRLEVGKTYEDGYGDIVRLVLSKITAQGSERYVKFHGSNNRIYVPGGIAPGLGQRAALVREVVVVVSGESAVDGCECGKEKFGFMMHERWCPEWFHPMTPTAALTQTIDVEARCGELCNYMTDGDVRAMREKTQ